MAKCEKLEKCHFYQGNMKMDEGIGAAYRRTYCEGDKTKCARYQVATKVGPEAVTLSLYPNMQKKADEIIAKAGK